MMEKAHKIEIIIDSVHVEKVLTLLERAGATGYTLLREVIGKGAQGVRPADEITGVFRNSYIITVCSEEVAQKVVESLAPLLKRIGGLCLLSEVQRMNFT
ncbi:MAG: hypothetical protein KatS3mg025_0666 [Bacteroidia bacterium]|nr:MAG: hypothetical protein KatS3mg025_0666 [Bacteroidia bacterium]